MVSPFLAPATVWHVIHVKADAMVMTQQVAPFLNWFRVATIESLQVIAALTSVDLDDSMLEQQHGIRTSLVPPPLIFAAPKPANPVAVILPDASAGPTSSLHEEGGDDIRVVGSGSTEPPPYLQCQHIMAAPRHLEYGGAAEKCRSCAAMEAACRRTGDSLYFRLPRIPYAVAVMVDIIQR